jgi:flagellar biosynthesis/type III secretory pathway protein FliH
MTDEQLTTAFEERYAEGRQRGYNEGYETANRDIKALVSTERGEIAERILVRIVTKLENTKGIGDVTLSKVRMALFGEVF